MMEKSAKGVGAPLRRKEDRRHLHGLGQFVADLRIPGVLEATNCPDRKSTRLNSSH